MWFIVYTVIVLIIVKLYIKLTTGWCSSQVCLKGKTAIVTGANTGIGYETALDLAKRGARVILACRSEQRAKEALDNIIQITNNNDVVYKIVDFGSLTSVRKFAEDIKSSEKRLDILVNNAGAYDTGDKISENGLLLLMQTNYFGPVLLTHLLLGMLEQTSGRIVNVASMAGKRGILKLEDINSKQLNTYMGLSKQYARTKLCNILYTIALEKKLRGTGVTTYSLHPGVVLTDIFRNISPLLKAVIEFLLKVFLKDTVEGAQTTIHCAVAQNIEQYSGEHFHDCKVVDRYSTVSDPELSRKLWDETMKLLKIE